mgnify:FL=1
MNMNKKFKYIDLFAGIGGMRIPFDELGGDCVFTSEFDKYAQQTYEANFNEIPDGDIKSIDLEKIPKHNLLLAGFPCQAFSHAGLKKGFDDTRGTLFFDIATILKIHKPKAFLLENVKGLKSHDGGYTFKKIIDTLNNIGYQTVEHQVFNARDFGLPQNRERVFIVGFWKHTNFYFPEPPKSKTRLGSILQKRVKEKYTISDKLWTSAIKRRERAISKGNGFSYKLFNRDSIYTSTLSARYYKDGLEILVEQQNKNPRRLTPLEARRLQGFPDNFEIPVSDAQAYKQFGNAVPVSVVREIAKNVISHI